MMLQLEIVGVLHRRHRISLKEIAILTPYSAQKHIIEKEYVADWSSEVTVATISESQGCNDLSIYEDLNLYCNISSIPCVVPIDC